MDITSYLAVRTQTVNEHLASLLPCRDGPHRLLYEAARYSLLGPGKRIRPLLTLATAEALGGSIEQALSPACALEMIHAYSLIHDDLPCMDDDDFRRGRPTLHKVYPEGHAVLTGDFLLTYAFEVMAKAPHLSNTKVVQLITLLARHAGGEGMIGGQALDIAYEGKGIPLDTLEQIHRGKTAALITAAVECGGLVADASPGAMALLSHFGGNIGLAFQIVDDILDVTASHEKHGHTLSSDAANNKTTYVSLLGIEAARAAAQELIDTAYAQLDALGLSNDSPLRALAHSIVSRAVGMVVKNK